MENDDGLVFLSGTLFSKEATLRFMQVQLPQTRRHQHRRLGNPGDNVADVMT